MTEYVARHAAVEGPGPWSKPGSVAFRLESRCWLNRRAGLEPGRHRAELSADDVAAGRLHPNPAAWRGGF